MSAELLSLLVEGCLATSAAVLLVLALRRPLARLFGAGCLPLLWGLVPLAQLAVWLPAPARGDPLAWQIVPAMVATAPEALAQPAVSAPFPAAALLALVWAAGALVAALYFGLLQRRFRRLLGRLQPLAGELMQAEHAGIAPAVLGLFRPRIILPADFDQRFSASQQALILAHERSHLRRGDVVAHAIATALRCAYWFNPLLHYATTRLRHDHELASDAEVMQRHPHARRLYADTLLDVQLAVPGLPVGCLWQSSHPLKERILMLHAKHHAPIRRGVGFSLVLALALGSAGVVWSSQPGGKPEAAAVPAPMNHVLLSVEFEGQEYTPSLVVAPGRSFVIRLGEPGKTWSAEFQYDADAEQFRSAEFEFNGAPASAVDLRALSRGEEVTTVGGDGASRLRLSAKVTELDAPPTESTVEGFEQADVAPSRRSLAAPAYPAAALEAGQEGRVMLRVLVGTDGSVRQVDVESATPPGVYDAAAIDAARRWTFNPAMRDGEAVESWVQVPICFSLDEDAEQLACTGEAAAADGLARDPSAGASPG